MKRQSILALCTIAYSFIATSKLAYAENEKPQSQIDPAFLNRSKKLPLPVYEIQQFRFDKIPWLTSEQVSQHMELYKGYVNKRNEIANTLKDSDRSSSAGVTYSEYRGLKTAETFAMNGDILHRLYFQNISEKKSQKPGEQMMQLINEAFGTLEAFKNDLQACASAARGWVLTAYSIDDNRIHNFLLDAHNQTVPVLVMPLLVLDVYEHAYFLDFGTKRPSYVQLFWNNINWEVVEERINKWVNPLIKPCESKEKKVDRLDTKTLY